MAILSLRAFCDESYAHRQSQNEKPFVIAGYIAPARVWMEFEGRWNMALSREHLPYFHMAACETRHDVFKEMEPAERERLQRVFIDVIKGFKIVGVAAGVSQDAIAEAREELSKWRARRPGEKQYMVEPYLFAFEMCVNSMVAYLEHGEPPRPHEKIAFVFDEQNEFEGRAHKVRNILVNCEQYRNRHRIGPLTYEKDTTSGCVPIQAADILAYEVMRELRDPAVKRWQLAELRLGYVAEPIYFAQDRVQQFLDRIHAMAAKT